MKRSELKLGQRVRVVPRHTNMDKPAPDETFMYVRELHNKLTAGLSRTPDSEHIYGVLYDVIYPLRPKTYNRTDLIRFHNFANEKQNKKKLPMVLLKEYDTLNPELSPKQKLINLAKGLKVNGLYKHLTGKDIKDIKNIKAEKEKTIKNKPTKKK